MNVNENAGPRMAEESIILRQFDFEVLQQLTVQFLELPDDRLVATGWSENQIARLGQVLRSVEVAGGSDTKLILHVVDESPVDSWSWGQQDGSPSLTLPGTSLRLLRSLCEAVLSTFDSHEMFYRTGYRDNEIRAAINKLYTSMD